MPAPRTGRRPEIWVDLVGLAAPPRSRRRVGNDTERVSRQNVSVRASSIVGDAWAPAVSRRSSRTVGHQRRAPVPRTTDASGASAVPELFPAAAEPSHGRLRARAKSRCAVCGPAGQAGPAAPRPAGQHCGSLRADGDVRWRGPMTLAIYRPTDTLATSLRSWPTAPIPASPRRRSSRKSSAGGPRASVGGAASSCIREPNGQARRAGHPSWLTAGIPAVAPSPNGMSISVAYCRTWQCTPVPQRPLCGTVLGPDRSGSRDERRSR